MRTVIICNEKLILERLTKHLKKANITPLGSFPTFQTGFNCIILEHPDVVFFCTFDGETNEYQKRIKAILPDVVFICFTMNSSCLKDINTEYVEYMLLALKDYKPEIVNIVKRSEKHEKPGSTPKIKCFGFFRIIVGDHEIKFATRRVRELLAFLLCHHNRTVYREDILQALFHSGDDKRDANNFRVTLYRLRSSLAAAKISDEYISIDEDYAVQIPPGICDLVDLLDFIQVNKGVSDSNVAQAKRVIDAFDGELFGDIDTPWVTDMREFVMIRMEELMLNTAQFLINTKQHMKEAEHILTRLLEFNDLSERSYMMLLELYIRRCEKVKFIYTYKRYARTMKLEFDSEPEQKYTRYYKSLIK